jgi:hypothetical protein
MSKFLIAVISGIVATVIGGLILNQLQGKGRRRGDVPGVVHIVASLPLEHATSASMRRGVPTGMGRSKSHHLTPS